MEIFKKIARYLKYLNNFRYKQVTVPENTLQRKEKILFSM